MTEELKPCPFCGGHGHLHQTHDWPDLFEVACGNCGATSHHGKVGEAAEAWNRRADGWVPVTERLPERAGGYSLVVHGKRKDILLAVWLGKRWHSPVTDSYLYAVTHWMPLPPPPAGDE